MRNEKRSVARFPNLPLRLDAPSCRRLALALVLGWSLGNAAATAQQAGSREAHRAALKLTAATAARTALRDLENLDLSGIERQWSEKILAEPASHRNQSKSREAFSQEYMEQLEQQLDDLLKRIHASFNPEQGSEPWFTHEWLVEHVTERFGDDIRRSLDSNRKERFAPLFERVRAAAVQGQLSGLTLSVRPSVEEVDEVNKAGWNSAAAPALRQALVERMGAGIPLLEETAHELERLARETLEEARRQVVYQESALEKPVPAGLKTAQDIDRALASQVEAAVNALRLAQGDESVYRQFPSIEERRRQKAESIEKQRFTTFAREYRFSGIEPRIQNLVQAETSRHREMARSREICLDSLLPQAAKEVAEAYSDNGSEDFRNRLDALLTGDSMIRQALRSRLADALVPALGEVRRGIAGRQLEAYFPAVSSGQWQVAENTLSAIHHREFSVESFEDYAALPFVRKGGRQPYSRQTLLEEAEQLVRSEVSKLLHEGQRAWVSQLRMVSSFEDVVESEIRNETEERTPDEWGDYFVKKLESKWQKERKDLWRGHSKAPARAAIKYLDIFGYAKSELRDLVRRQYDLVEKEAQADSDPSPTRKEGPGVPGGPSLTDGDSSGSGLRGNEGGRGNAESCTARIRTFGQLASIRRDLARILGVEPEVDGSDLVFEVGQIVLIVEVRP